MVIYKTHAVAEVQYCDGVRGVIIVYDPKDPLKPLYDGVHCPLPPYARVFSDINSLPTVDNGEVAQFGSTRASLNCSYRTNYHCYLGMVRFCQLTLVIVRSLTTLRTGTMYSHLRSMGFQQQIPP